MRWLRVAAALSLFAWAASSCFTFPEPSGTGGAGSGGAPTTCSTDADCDDAEVCTKDHCGEDKICVHTAVNDGPAPDAVQKAGDCMTVRCDDGRSKNTPDDTDFFDDDNDCTVDTCNAGQGYNTPKVKDAPCTLMGNGGRCDDAATCTVACTTAADCQATSPCVTAECDTSVGVCSFPPLSDGTPTPGVTDVKGDCQIRVCMGGVDVSVANDADVPVTGTDCDQEICENGVPSNPPLALDTPCQTFNTSQPGHCDDTGTCRQCAIDSECGGAIDDCKYNACVNYACTVGFVPVGTPTTTNPPQVPGDCQTIRCDGAGNAPSDLDDTDLPEDGNVCQDDICTAGVPSHAPHPAIQCGTSGGMPTICTAMGQCGCQGDGDCAAPNTCGGGNPGSPLVCGCTKKTCAQVSATCGTVTDGCFGTQNCNNNAQNGSETDVDCGGSPAKCATRCGQGKKCSATSDCQTGLFCVDGVCCNSTCNGACQACTNAKTGGTTGVCGSITSGTDPDNECNDQGGSSCGTTGLCGNGACAFYPSSTVCQAALCTGSTLTKAKSCNGTGTCTAPMPATQGCAPYTCNTAGNACATSCTSDLQCAAGNYCSSGLCVAKIAQGAACSGANQCTTGFCVDNRCCDTACNTACQACSAARKQSSSGNGTCGNAVVGAFDPRNLCGTSPPCGNTGSCAAGGVCEKTASGTQCAAASCTGNQATPPQTCDGSGTCQTVTGMICNNNLVCQDATTCWMACGTNDAAGDARCIASFYCTGASCQPDKGTAQPCTRNSECANGTCLGNNKCN